MEGWVWLLIMVVVAIVIFWLVYKGTMLDPKNADMPTMVKRVNLLWALLVVWVLAEIFWWVYLLFFSNKPGPVHVGM